MTRHLVIRDRARREMDDAAGWYERDRPGLGEEFVRELEQLLARIQDTPEQFPLVSDDAKRGLVRRFPFAVYFVAENQRVVVLAVVHLHRHPDAWKGDRS